MDEELFFVRARAASKLFHKEPVKKGFRASGAVSQVTSGNMGWGSLSGRGPQLLGSEGFAHMFHWAP